MKTAATIFVLTLFLAACGDDKSPQVLPVVDPTHVDGDPCTINQDCKGGSCLNEIGGWPGGMCTTLDCEDGCNGPSRACLPLLGTTACLVRCEFSEECRENYACELYEGEKICMPQTSDGPIPGRAGGACETVDGCSSGLVCDLEQPGGYCYYPDCEKCGEDGACIDGKICGQKCFETRDCRIGYLCRDRGGDDHACVPGPVITPVIPFETTRDLLGITCEATKIEEVEDTIRWRLDFVTPETEGFVVVPFVASGQIEAFRMTGPEDLEIDLVHTYRHQNIRATDLGTLGTEAVGLYKTISFDWPIQVPYAPQFADYAKPGAPYSMFVETDGASPCIYVLGAEDGTLIDFNIHLVGVDGLTAATAADNPSVQAVMARVAELYARAGVTLGKVRFFDTDEETTERYRIVRGFADIRLLTALTEAPGPTLDDHLSVDIFWVMDILLGQTSGLLLGVSAGVPGAPGMHGNANNGLVFRVVDLNAKPDFVAHIMAHEVGHFLGLRHTTEILNGIDSEAAAAYDAIVGLTDPLSDTPVCDNVIQFGKTCPDYQNLMFPAAPDPDMASGDEVGLMSAQQGAMMRLSPLVKVAPE